MGKLLTGETLLVMGTALVVALFFLWPAVQENFIGFIIYRGLCIGDILFHEMGHALFYWLFGKPAIPSILTAIGADMAGGYTMAMQHSWMVQVIVWCGLVYGCYKLYLVRPMVCWPAVLFTVLVMALSFTRYTELIIAYMGHGTAIIAGGVLLYRAWLNIIVRTGFERWCNALFGFFILLNNANFSYKLLYTAEFKARYEDAAIPMDFVAMSDMQPFWPVAHIAWFTIGLCAAAFILSFALAAYFYEDEHYSS